MTPEAAAPVRSHRHTGAPHTTVGRLGRWIGTAALVVATLAVGTAVSAHTPDDDTQQGPYVRTAAIGATVDVRTFTATVLGVRGAALLAQDGTAHDTSGVWIIVRVRLTARATPVTVGYGALVDAGGRTYRATGRVDQTLLGSRVLEPGVPVTGEIAFEVPAPVATGLSIRLARDELDQRMDAEAQIRLPITATQVSTWRAEKTPATLAAPVATP